MRIDRALALVLALVLAAPAARAADDEDNPHEKMVKDKAVCLDCHTKVPKPGEHAPDYFLVDAPSDNCLGCHAELEHPGVHEHAGKDARPLPGDENGHIACFTCHDPHPAGVIPGRNVYSSDVGGATRAFAAMRGTPKHAEPRTTPPMFGALLRVPAAAGEGCLLCHGDVRDDTRTWRERLLWDKFLRLYSY
jgi:hypothetical protein